MSEEQKIIEELLKIVRRENLTIYEVRVIERARKIALGVA
jgi:hypothetical protein